MNRYQEELERAKAELKAGKKPESEKSIAQRVADKKAHSLKVVIAAFRDLAKAGDLTPKELFGRTIYKVKPMKKEE